MNKRLAFLQKTYCRLFKKQNHGESAAQQINNADNSFRHIRKDWIFFGITFLLLFCSFYHNTLASGFDLLFGDNGDTRFNLLIVEHWIQFFCGDLDFAEPRMFYPADYGVGFSDLSFAVALLELPLRLIGLDLYRSTQIVYYLFHLIGAASCFYLLRYQLRLHLLPSLIGMLIICFSNAMYVKLYHTQFYNYYLLPLLLVLIIQYCRYPAGTKFGRRAITLIAAMLAAVLILYTGFYTIFYTVFFSAAFAAGCLLAFLYRQNREDVSAFLQWLKIRLPEAALTAFLGLAALIPFLIIYWPVVQLGYKRPWYEIRKCLLKPYDFFNVGADNFLWSSWLKNTFPQ